MSSSDSYIIRLDGQQFKKFCYRHSILFRKIRKCTLLAFSFTHHVSRSFQVGPTKYLAACYKLKPLAHNPKTLKKAAFENIVGKGENAGNLQFLLFPQCFLSHQRQKVTISAKFIFCLQMPSNLSSKNFC